MIDVMTADKQMAFVGVRGTIRCDEPMSNHTSWKVGGPARYFFEPADRKDLSAFLKGLDPEVPVLWLGLGSNLLVRDGGFDGAVIAAHRGLREIRDLGEGRFAVDAGVSCARFSRFAAKHGWSGGEFLAGVPGTMGGALAMNAGAFGSETWNLIEQVELVNRAGSFQKRPAGSFAVSYRQVDIPPEHWFIAGVFRLSQGRGDEGANVRSLLEKRSETQPVRQSSAGSVFRNPPNDYAARLIEISGLKGLRIGGAQVSMQHANFIVNDRQACAKDIETLIEKVQTTVADHTGIRLEPEVRFVGEHQ